MHGIEQFPLRLLDMEGLAPDILDALIERSLMICDPHVGRIGLQELPLGFFEMGFFFRELEAAQDD